MTQETPGTGTTIALDVTGMHCTGCTERVSRVLDRLPGVQVLTADHQANRIEVRLEHGGSSVEDVRERIEVLGYTVGN